MFLRCLKQCLAHLHPAPPPHRGASFLYCWKRLRKGVSGRRCIMGPLRALTTREMGLQFQERGCPRMGYLVGEKDLESRK